ncbi:MAG: hypothetical protein BGP03_02705 [Pseudonocardia sp. 73-21]|jgi:hypothetical protein|nr:MAG: hypothetical protein BGP03_02705 [Pseudonocardia sp. 73-21]
MISRSGPATVQQAVPRPRSAIITVEIVVSGALAGLDAMIGTSASHRRGIRAALRDQRER